VAILNTLDAFSLQLSPFAELMNHVKNTVSSKFPENINTTIGGFIFLRFFCPAISSPEAYGIVDGKLLFCEFSS
jgi:neurofibromin 1